MEKTNKDHGESSWRGSSRGGRSFNRGRGRSNGPPKCFRCNQIGNYPNKCPKRPNNNNQGERRTQLVQEEKNLEVEEGMALMMRQSFLQVPHAQEPAQRKNLFRTRIKCKERVCNLLIDSGSTENLVSKEMVQKLELEIIPHPYPYNVSWLTKGQKNLVI